MTKKEFEAINGEHWKAGYCEIYYLLKALEELGKATKIGYNSGVYGWNSDIYLLNINERTIVLSTGYRAFNGREINHEEAEELEKALRKGWTKKENLLKEGSFSHLCAADFPLSKKEIRKGERTTEEGGGRRAVRRSEAVYSSFPDGRAEFRYETERDGDLIDIEPIKI